nr:uncharacterized protein LOC101236985 [Hydra vulgaris]
MESCDLKNENKKTAPEQELIDWLFCCKEKFSVKHSLDIFPQKSPDQITDKQVVSSQKDFSVFSLWGKSISEDPNVTIFDDIKYLFKNDTFKSHLQKNFFNNGNWNCIRSLKTSGANTRFQQKLKDSQLVKKFSEEIQTNVENLNKNKIDIQPFNLTSKILNDSKTSKRMLDDYDDDETSFLEKKIKVDTILSSSYNNMTSKSSTKNVASMASSKNETMLTSNQNGLVVTGKKIMKSISSFVSGHKKNNVEIVEDEDSVGSKVECPMCHMLFDEVSINIHAFNCQGPILTRKSSRSSQVSNQNMLFNQDDWIKACENLDPKFPEEKAISDEVLKKYVSDNVWKESSKQKEKKIKKNQHVGIPIKEISVVEESSKQNPEVFRNKQSKDPNLFSSKGKDARLFLKKLCVPSENTLKIKTNKNASKRNFDDSQNDPSDFKCCKCQEMFTTVALLQCHTDLCLSE